MLAGSQEVAAEGDRRATPRAAQGKRGSGEEHCCDAEGGGDGDDEEFAGVADGRHRLSARGRRRAPISAISPISAVSAINAANPVTTASTIATPNTIDVIGGGEGHAGS